MNDSSTPSHDGAGQPSAPSATAVSPDTSATPGLPASPPPGASSTGAAPVSSRPRGGTIAAIVGGGVLALALAFGGGVTLGATAFSGGQTSGPSAPWGDQGAPGVDGGPRTGGQPPTGGDRPERPGHGQDGQSDDRHGEDDADS